MKHRVTVLMAVAVLLFVALPSTSHAQNVTIITVEFPFVVQGTTVPAGTYVLRLSQDMTQFTLTQTDTPAPAEDISVETQSRLAAMHPPRGEAHVVFDKSGDTYFLSEIWLPDQDGWLVYASTGNHTRKTVKGMNKMQ